MGRTTIGYDTILIAHIVTGLVGYGACFITGLMGYRAITDPLGEATVRYFSPGLGLADGAIFVVPVFGVALVVIRWREFHTHPMWIWIGVVMWVFGVGVYLARVWPTQVRIKKILENYQQDNDARSGSLIVSQASTTAAVTGTEFTW